MPHDLVKFWSAAVLVWAILLIPAFAQEATQQSPPQNPTLAPSAPGTNGVNAPLGPPGPRFQVNLTKFEVFDETGFDFLDPMKPSSLSERIGTMLKPGSLAAWTAMARALVRPGCNLRLSGTGDRPR